MAISVFISYRRDGGEGFAQMFNMMLSQKGYRVFYDIESLGVGLFNEKLLREIEAADVFLVLLTKGALDRCVNEGDWVRREIAHAISQNKPIVPVFFRGFEFPATLPSELQKLPYYNGLNFSSMEYFDAKMDKLAHMLNEAANLPKDTSKPAPTPAQTAPKAAPVPTPTPPPAPEQPVKAPQTPEEWHAMGMQYYDQQQYTKAVPCFTRAVEQGHVEAQCNLGNCYYKIGDYPHALYWYREAAEQGDARAQCNLGYCYYCGQGVAKDFAQAIYWYKKAIEQGNAQAQLNLGFCYMYGQGVAKDLTQAVYWFKKAAEQGFATAQFNLGVCYINGQGVAKDDSQAVYWFKKAAEQGHATAKEQLAKLTNA